jgi:tetratricopeptide (TPR) repeat protein
MKTPLALVLLAVLGVTPLASAQQQPWSGASVLQDPEWRARFLGSYGVLSGVEPEITADERALLPDVLALMETDPEAAAKLLESKIGPSSSAALDFLLANLLFQSDQQDAAIARYRDALKKYPDFRRAHKNLGLLMVQKGDFPAALEHLTRALELGDRDGRLYGLIGHSYLNQEQYVPAEAAYRNALLLQPNVRDWKLGLARALLAMESHKEAAALFDQLLAESPEDAASWMLQANAYLGMEKPMAAAVNLEAVRMLGKAQNSSLVLLGDIYMNAGMYELARSAYTEAIERDGEAAGFDTARRAAELLVRARAWGDAQKVLATIDRRHPKLGLDDELDVLTLKAKVARGQGRDAEAAKLLETIVTRDGTRGDALLELAAWHNGQGDLERATLFAERAQKLEDYEYQALLLQAQFLVGARDYKKATEVLRRATQIKSEPRVERFLAAVEQAVRPE